MIYLQLFFSFLQIGLFSVGGGYAAIPLIQEQVVHLHQWLSLKEFYDIVTIAEMTPGPMAINAATFVGIKIAGIPGAFLATFSTVLPSILIVTSLASLLYYRRGHAVHYMERILYGLRPAVVAMITSAALGLMKIALLHENRMDFFELGLFLLGVYALRKKKISPMIVLAASGAIFFVVKSLLPLLH